MSSEEKPSDAVGCDASIMKSVWEIRAKEQEQKQKQEQQRLQKSALTTINKDWENRRTQRVSKYQRMERKPEQTQTPTDDISVWKSKRPEVPRTPQYGSGSGSVLSPRADTQTRRVPAEAPGYKSKKDEVKKVSKLDLLRSIEQSSPSSVGWRHSWIYDKCLPMCEDGITDWGESWMFAVLQPCAQPGEPWMCESNQIESLDLHLWKKPDYKVLDSEELDHSLFTDEWQRSWKKSNQYSQNEPTDGGETTVSPFGDQALLLESHLLNKALSLSEWRLSWIATKPTSQLEHLTETSSECGESWGLVNRQGNNKSQMIWTESWRLATELIDGSKISEGLQRESAGDSDDDGVLQDKTISGSLKSKYGDKLLELRKELKALSEWNKSWQVSKNNAKPCEELQRVLTAVPPKMETGLGAQKMEKNLREHCSVSELEDNFYKLLKDDIIYELKTKLTRSKLRLKRLEEGLALTPWRDSWKSPKCGMKMEKKAPKPEPLMPLKESEKQVGMVSMASAWKESRKLICQILEDQDPRLWQRGWVTMRPIRVDRAKDKKHFPHVDLPVNGLHPEKSWRESRRSVRSPSKNKILKDAEIMNKSGAHEAGAKGDRSSGVNDRWRLPGDKSQSPDWASSWKSAEVVIDDRKTSDRLHGQEDRDTDADKGRILENKILALANKRRHGDRFLRLCQEMKALSTWSKSWQITKNNSRPCQEVEKMLKALSQSVSLPKIQTDLREGKKMTDLEANTAKKPTGTTLEAEEPPYKLLKNDVIYELRTNVAKALLLLLRLEERLQQQLQSNWRDSWKTLKHKTMERRGMGPDPTRPLRESERKGPVMPTTSEWRGSWRISCVPVYQNSELWQHGWTTIRPLRVDRALDQDNFPPVDLPRNGPNPERSWRDSWRHSRDHNRSIALLGGAHISGESAAFHRIYNAQFQSRYARPVSGVQSTSGVSQRLIYHDSYFQNNWEQSWRSAFLALNLSEQDLQESYIIMGMEIRPLKEMISLKKANTKMSPLFNQQVFREMYPEKLWRTSWTADSVLSHLPKYYKSSDTLSKSKSRPTVQQPGLAPRPALATRPTLAPEQALATPLVSKWGWSFRLANPMPQMKDPWFKALKLEKADDEYYENLKNTILYDAKTKYSKFMWLIVRLEVGRLSSMWRDSCKTPKYVIMKRKPNPFRLFEDPQGQHGMVRPTSEWQSSWKLTCRDLRQEPKLWPRSWPSIRLIREDRALDQRHFPLVDLPRNGPNPEKSWRDSWKYSGRLRLTQLDKSKTSHGEPRVTQRTTSSSYSNNTPLPKRHVRPLYEMKSPWMDMMGSKFELHDDMSSLKPHKEARKTVLQVEHLTENWLDERMEIKPLKEKLSLQRAQAKLSRSFDDQIFKERYPGRLWSASWSADSLLIHQPSYYPSSAECVQSKSTSVFPKSVLDSEVESKWGKSFRLANPMPQLKEHWLESLPTPCHYPYLLPRREKKLKIDTDISKNKMVLMIWSNSYLLGQQGGKVHSQEPWWSVKKSAKRRKHLYLVVNTEKSLDRKFADCHLLSKTQPRFRRGSLLIKLKTEDDTQDKFLENWAASWKFLYTPGEVRRPVRSLSGWTDSWKFLLPLYESMS